MQTTTEIQTGPDSQDSPHDGPPPRITYVAYPTSLTLQSANAVQTYATARELRRALPAFELLLPRFAWRPSAFTALGATHLARIPFNAGRHLIPTIGWSYLERTWFAGRVLARLLRHRLAKRAVDVIYVRDAVCAAWLSYLARRLVGASVIYEIHDLESQNPSAKGGPLMRRAIKLVDRVALQRADGVVSLTATFADLLRSRPDLRPRGPIAVIPDAYDEQVFFPRDRSPARAKLGLAEDAFIVLYFGLTFAYHEVDRLVDSFALLAHERPNARLLLVGGREGERQSLAQQAERLGIGAALMLVPPRQPPVVATYLAAADAVALPGTYSKASASPLKLFECAASGRPLVAVDLPALREILPDDTAYYVPAADLHAFAAALRRVAEHPDEAAQVAARAVRAVAPHTYRARAAAIVAMGRRVRQGRS